MTSPVQCWAVEHILAWCRLLFTIHVVWEENPTNKHWKWIWHCLLSLLLCQNLRILHKSCCWRDGAFGGGNCSWTLWPFFCIKIAYHYLCCICQWRGMSKTTHITAFMNWVVKDKSLYFVPQWRKVVTGQSFLWKCLLLAKGPSFLIRSGLFPIHLGRIEQPLILMMRYIFWLNPSCNYAGFHSHLWY